MCEWNWWSFAVGAGVALLAARVVWRKSMWIEIRNAPSLDETGSVIPDEELGR